MTRILFVSYTGLLGGAERVLLDCAASIEGDHALMCPDGPLAEAADRSGLTVYQQPPRQLRLRGGPRIAAYAMLALIAHAREIRRLSRDLDPDLVLAWGVRSAIAALSVPRSRQFAFDHHEFLPGPLIGRVVRVAARRADRVTVPSRAAAEDLDPRGKLAEKVAVVPPGVDPTHYADLPSPSDRDASLVMIGALVELKQPQLALEIIDLARRELPGLTLRIVGAPVIDDPSVEQRLMGEVHQRRMDEAVELVGAVPDVRPELARSSVLLHCAARESFGIVLLEAMASGRAVIAPDAGGPREIVDDACGVLYAPGDAGGGASAVVRVLSDSGRAKRMGIAGRKHVQRHFTRAQSQQRFAAAYSPLLPELPRGSTDLAVVTVTHNSAPELTRLLTSLQTHLPEAQVLVVDCDSEDESLDVARAAARARAVELGQNVGFGRACNRGIAELRAKVTVLLNPDVEVVDDSLLALVAEVQRLDRPERILAPLVLNSDGTRQQTAHPVPGSLPELVRAVVPPAAVPGPALAPWRSRVPRQVGWLVGAALVARTDTFRRLGPFDESIFMYGEDLELGLRAAEAGVSSWFWPTARVRHSGAHAARAEFGGEPFDRLAQARNDVIRRRLGPRRASLDNRSQALTFASRAALKRMLGRPNTRELTQLAAVRKLLARG